MRNVLRDYPFSVRYYLLHPHVWLKHTAYNLRDAYHRVTRGWAATDVWNLDSWFGDTFSAMIRYLAENGHGYPGVPPWDTPEKWKDALLLLESDLKRIIDEDYWEARNEYAAPYYELVDKNRKSIVDANGFTTTYYENEAEVKAMSTNCMKRAEELMNERKALIKTTFAQLGEMFDSLWD